MEFNKKEDKLKIINFDEKTAEHESNYNYEKNGAQDQNSIPELVPIPNYDDSIAKNQELNRYHLVTLEYISILITLASFIIYAVLAFEDKSVSALAFSTDSFLDVLAYIVVIWRFSSKNELHSTKKDRKALILLSIFFLVSSVAVAYDSVNNLVNKVAPKKSVAFLVIGFVECAIFFIISLFKFYLAKKMDYNRTVISDAINSSIAGFDGLAMGISMAVFINNDKIWYLDATFGLVMTAFVFAYGCKLFIHNVCFHAE